MKAKKVLLLTGDCSHQSCRKRSTLAIKITGDMWAEFCEEHKGGEITLDLNKIGVYIDADRVRPKP